VLLILLRYPPQLNAALGACVISGEYLFNAILSCVITRRTALFQPAIAQEFFRCGYFAQYLPLFQ